MKKPINVGRALFLFCLCLASAHAQVLVSGTITSQATACQPGQPTTACVTLQLSTQTAQAAITVNGTFSGTLQFEASPDGGTTWVNIPSTPSGGGAAVTQTTTTGVWVAPVGGYTFLRVRCSIYTSGVAVVALNPSQAAAPGTSSGSTNGTVSANNGSAGAVANYPSAGGSTTVAADATLVDTGSTLTYSGTTGGIFPAGSTTVPGLQVGASATGIQAATATTLGLVANGVTAAIVTGGVQITTSGSFKWSQTALSNGSVGLTMSAVGTAATEALNLGGSSTGLFLQNQCKVSTTLTLTTQTTICTWTLPNSAQTWAWQCQGTYSTTAATITFTLGMVVAQTPTAAISANAVAYTATATSPTWATTTAANTTATTILAVTPAAATNNLPWQSSGTIPASATSGTFILYGTASTTSDVTIGAGTTCSIY
jgi:hypothetical protein